MTTHLVETSHLQTDASAAPERRERPWARAVVLLAALVVATVLPWFVYPPIALDILCWGLFAISVDLLLGYTGLLSFGHAAFWGSSAYITGIVAIETGMPFPVAVLLGALAAMLIAVPTGWLAVRSTGIYFAMVTLAFAQMLYFVANRAAFITGGENGLQGIPRSFFGIEVIESEPFYFYYAALPLILLGCYIAWRMVHSPFGRVLLAIRDNPARARALGFDVESYKIVVFVVSAGIAGIAGGVFSSGHGFASLNDLMWTTSGKAVLITVLGGIGTLWGALLGSGILVTLEDQLTTLGFEGIGIVTGTMFVVIVLLFRRGVWGSAHQFVAGAMRRARSHWG